MLGSGTAGAAEPGKSVPHNTEHDEVRFLTGDSRPKLYRFGCTVLSLSSVNTARVPPKVLRFVGFRTSGLVSSYVNIRPLSFQ